ncbi:uncharacterized protein LOC118437626 [Folsomia candida]|uniref:uncharacterized protein LOC118437626 n=1 Tax=Folsomia candida TaxID=158441 RepID=UPI001604C389|nr:uncharacterized protein LOC118437626 [Folsomia candida]
MPYSIVHFVETDEVEIIPINWLSASKNKCWWPPYKSSERQSKAVMNGDTPNQQVWLSFDVKVLGGGKIFGSYNQAKNNVGKALEETDPEFESDLEVTGRGQRHKKTVHLPPPGDSDSEEEPPKMKQNRSIPTKTIPPPPQYFSLVGEGLQSEKEDGHESSLPGPSDPPSPTNSQQYQGTLSSEQVLSSSHELESRSIPQAEDIDTTFGRDNGTSPNAGNLGRCVTIYVMSQ